MGRRSAPLALVAAGLTIGSAANDALAEIPVDRAAAEALSSAASKLMARGDYQQGCANYELSNILDPSPLRLLKLADCSERRGLTASAWAWFAEARDMAEEGGETELARVAEKGVARLEPRLGRIEIVVPSAADVEGLEVRRDGVLVPEAVIGVQLPVDPGLHVISARAPGKRPWAVQVGLTRGRSTVTIFIPTLEDEPELELSEFRAVSPLPSPPGETERKTDDTWRMIGWGLGITGVTSLAVGTVFAVKAAATQREIEMQCDTGRRICPAAAFDQIDQVQAQATAATVFLGLGAASLFGGAIVYLASASPKSSEHPSASLRIAPAVGPSAASLIAVGTF